MDGSEEWEGGLGAAWILVSMRSECVRVYPLVERLIGHYCTLSLIIHFCNPS